MKVMKEIRTQTEDRVQKTEAQTVPITEMHRTGQKRTAETVMKAVHVTDPHRTEMRRIEAARTEQKDNSILCNPGEWRTAIAIYDIQGISVFRPVIAELL